MKIEFELQGVCFEWNDKKALLNLQNHGINFEEACEVFLDPFVKSVDSEIVESEMRDKIIGMTEIWQVLLVVYTERDHDIFRIISARRATSKERRQYEKQ
ncbi:MAG: BrnT family toxin [Bacteroidetes bacterium]|jgi:uncharacterized protein|nr:BrnT family toxin [Bacteroidota bacterium]MBT4286897.1 BrnT family toxin [Deltaproteobacteria bacterium]MBT4723235.1 BrnT family toxin [Candidatus Falkowbacteria bacterium]